VGYCIFDRGVMPATPNQHKCVSMPHGQQEIWQLRRHLDLLWVFY
jgi:hypothetical protein